ncbi:hypothetical protein FOA52_013050 [Chlamydomonas sp. UWO 241]|nr:hypothetical protein FOA52_013050 [Chlamydomonas sp. UWO 241]
MCRPENGLFVVGPESAAAHPGPVCYKKVGHLAITDANLTLGRVLPDFFPKIFGPHENEPLDVDGAMAAFQALANEVNAYEAELGRPAKSIDEIAMGFITVANESMCRPIRALTQMKGYDAAAHVLASFGGAGGQHACAIAAALGMRTIFIHRFAGILSAVGIHLADIVAEAQEPCAAVLAPAGGGPADAGVMSALEATLARLEAPVAAQLKDSGFDASSITMQHFLNLRYQGTDVAVMTARPDDGDYVGAFTAAYAREFGFTLDRSLLVDDVRVRGVGRSRPLAQAEGGAPDPGPLPPPVYVASVYFLQGGRQRTPVYSLTSLLPRHKLLGPALLIDDISTILVEPGWAAHMTAGEKLMSVRMDRVTDDAPQSQLAMRATTALDPVQLAIFSHRFMGIAEQMGRTLQRTSISVNVKERLDFSCALFGPDGSLVANAPHLPVHLGAMSEAVNFQVRYYTSGPGSGEGLHEGDVLMSNHPQLAGGSHLPDITVITPVFESGHIVFFVASRGHHADIGGISPGSMPPHSKLLIEEGAAVVSFKIVDRGVFQEAGVVRLLTAPGELAATIPGMSGTRNLEDNLSDLRAQVAANTRGIQLVGALINEYSLPVVQAYMGHIQANAEAAVREMLREFSLQQGLPEVGTVTAEDMMDDGSPIRLAVTIDRTDGSAIFDFTGTGPEVYGNCNAPPAVAYSAIIYSLRCMVTRDIPLNQGCLAPVTVKIPPNCLLNPSPEAAVVGGNVLTSQRVTDVVLKAFQAAAASQGCMNNLTFGDEGMGYYETIAGGAGAGPGWHGRSGVHTHMTNTRITDPEILERRYPVVLRCFKLRPGTGGTGLWHGGDGVVREIETLRPIDVGILSERRSMQPFGLQGGGPGTSGINLLRRADGRVVNIGSKATAKLGAGDYLQISTPGGGGFGDPHDADAVDDSRKRRKGEDGPAAGAGLTGGSVAEYKRRQEQV